MRGKLAILRLSGNLDVCSPFLLTIYILTFVFEVYLSPEIHGRGIMPAVLKTLINHFVVPYINAHIITGSYLGHNAASKRVFEKNGFKIWVERDDFIRAAGGEDGDKREESWTGSHEMDTAFMIECLRMSKQAEVETYIYS